ncbi:MAG: Tol-Pal system protein TolB [Pseudomonadota bacterium]
MLRYLILALVAAMFAVLGARAELTIRLTEGTFEPLPTAIPDFEAENPEAADLALQISEVVRNDLVSTGLFSITDPAAFIQKDLSIDVQPRFADWKIINTDALVVGQAEILDDGRLRVAFRLWDVYGEDVLRLDGQAGRQYVTTPDNWRRIAHKIADSIYTRLTGESGFFDTRIVYIAETGPKTSRMKRLAIMDYDGANNQYLTEGLHTVLTPRFSPSAQEITYMSYEGNKPRVYLFNIETGRQEVLGDFQGMTFAPRFSRDGRSVLLTQARNGNSEIHVMDLRSRQSRQLTDHPAIDTSPSMSPDGRQIVFNSDRGGSPQLYIMNTDGSPLTCPSGGRDTACLHHRCR